MGGYDGRAIANFILDFCDRNGRAVTNLSLQKIVYFCHVWSLIELGRPLVRHKFEAWEYGPVLPYLYREFRKFDRLAIAGRATQINPRNGQSEVVQYAFDTQTETLLNQIVAFYSRLRASDLVELSHAEGGPWHSVWNHGGRVNPGMKIDDVKIQEFYSKATCPNSIQ
ncbi:Panacea domain-containing protein [Chelatococcus sp. GCM10030263]|uniref:Panacea domain-containing protein n=1 Tax=Chelatococcus sp. GCM10030263 TaxID=3273387 RepID=UPI00361394DF